MEKNRLEELLVRLYRDPKDKFYAHLFFHVCREETKEVPTMGVGIINGKLKLVYNPEFLDKLSDEAAIEVLKHEALHLINQHILRGQGHKENDMLKHKMENIAQDCAINQYLNEDIINEIGGVTLDRFRGLLSHAPKTFQLKPKMTAEYYYDHLEQEKEKREEEQGEQGEQGPQGKGGQGDGLGDQLDGMAMDSHDLFGDLDALDQAMLEDKIKKAAESAKGDGAGKLPSEVEELLKLMKKPTVSWQRELRQFIGQGSRSEKTNTRSRRNRRYGITFPGHKRDYKAKILTVLDTSGSMHGDRTNKVLSELYGIYKAMDGVQLDIVECDAKIQDVFTYDGKSEFKITGRGGTEMVPALKYAHENKYDGVIMLTDGEFWNEDFKGNNKVQSLWVIAGNSKFTSTIGRTVHIKDDSQ